MNEFEYCYWLMGIFELGKPTQFNAKQLELIDEHLKLVTHREKTFCNWLEGVLDANGLENMSEKKVSLVLERLRSEFYNVIDKSYPRELWEPLQAAHEGKEFVAPVKKPQDDKPKFEAMC